MQAEDFHVTWSANYQNTTLNYNRGPRMDQWGAEQKLWEGDGDYFALERYEDFGAPGRQPGSGEAIMVMAINDSGNYQQRTLTTGFQPGTVLGASNTYFNMDDDNDDLPDAWEIQYGLDPFDAAGDEGKWGDKDGDGLSNYEEWLAGTDPDDPGDVLRITSVSNTVDMARIAWSAVEGRDYRLQSADNLLETPVAWTTEYGFATADNPRKLQASAMPPNVSNRVYRIQVRR